MGEHAMLHVEHGDVLMHDGLPQAGVEPFDEIGELLPIQIITRRQSQQALGSHQIGGQFIRHVEREVAHELRVRRMLAEKLDRGQVATQHDVRIAVAICRNKPSSPGLSTRRVAKPILRPAARARATPSL